MRSVPLCCLCMCMLLCLSVGPTTALSATVSPACRVAATVEQLQTEYDASNGGWGCTIAVAVDAGDAASSASVGWWNCANSMEAVCNYIAYAHNTSLVASVVESKSACSCLWMCWRMRL